MSEVQTTPRLSLFRIKAELLGLVEAREDCRDRIAAMSQDELTASPEIGAELATLNGLIKQYIGKEVQKVDSCAVVVQEYTARCKARREAAAELNKQADADEETVKAVKGLLLEVMQEFGDKKLYGAVHTISRQGNGGVQALTIAQPDLIPLEFKRVTVELRADVCREFADKFAGKYRILEIVHPDKEDIREVLETSQKQRQAILKAAEVSGVSITDERVARDLSALPGVPGCRLEPRGESIRIK